MTDDPNAWITDPNIWIKLSNRSVWGDGSGTGVGHSVATSFGKIWHKTRLRRKGVCQLLTLTFHLHEKFRVVLKANLGEFVDEHDDITRDLSSPFYCVERVKFLGSYYSIPKRSAIVSYQFYGKTTVEEFEEMLVILKLSVL